MHLKSLTMKGFKSFPDRTRLEFSPGVSVIVGPNGSGKSNITDAVLWALGEQSPLNVRGSSMQDVIFAGAHGVQARPEAEVEVVIDNEGGVDVPLSEISISRRLDRAGDGEYRINGAKCRLGDVVEILSDTGLGKEMHSVVSQGRVTSIVTSKPKDRRMLIEEAAGLGKHRKRRRRAQLKLERTQDNLDRALDVEREARSRLRPLKRQAEAAELHERLERQTLEARWTLARDAARSARAAEAAAGEASQAARAAAAEIETELREVAARRAAAELALTSRGSQSEALSGRFHGARSAAERIEAREEATRTAIETVTERARRRRALVEALESEAQGDEPDAEGLERIAGLETELEQLAADGAVRLERELAELETRRAAAAEHAEAVAAVAAERAAERRAADEAFEAARGARRAAEAEADKARREAARIGSELASLNQFLRSNAGAPGGAAALADSLRAADGYELALAAVLGPRLRAAVADDVPAARALLEKAGRDGGLALVEGPGHRRGTHPPASVSRHASPVDGAVALADHVSAADAVAGVAGVLLDDVWVVDALDGLPDDFRGVAVTRDGLVFDAAVGELRKVPAGGEDRVLAKRNQRDALVGLLDAAAAAEQTAKQAVEAAVAAAREADGARDEVDRAARAAAREHQDALEAVRQVERAAQQRRRAPDDTETATRRAQVQAAIAAEKRLLEQAERRRAERARRITGERERAVADEALAPRVEALATALAAAKDAVRAQVEVFEAAMRAEREAGEQLAGELRSCAQAEAGVQTRLKAAGEAVTVAEVKLQQAKDRAQDAGMELTALAERLGLEPEPADEALADEERDRLRAQIERLQRRREQLGPVNPLAKAEYDEAVAHVEELETQREDTERAIRELQAVIKETDQKIKTDFEETFTAAARNFEDLVGQLFPGGRGRLRLVREDAGPRPVLGGADGEDAPAPDDVEAAVEAAADAEEQQEQEDLAGVEIEITPAGKATKRLSLLSGGEKSMTALAFLFAVFLARPCPFYILDEVEAALDDLNIDRFLTVLRRYADRAQFIVVTHQKRTMEAADCLYGVSMAGNGVSKVVSRRLPREAEQPAAA